MDEKKEVFRFAYSAEEQKEIQNIRRKYTPPTEEATSMERLRRLDASATKRATVIALIVGIAGTLLLGVGMCCTMVSGWEAYFLPGIVVGAIGIAGVTASYPLYKRMVKRKMEKLAPEIIRLSDELMK